VGIVLEDDEDDFEVSDRMREQLLSMVKRPGG
jgi:hypothetical protein